MVVPFAIDVLSALIAIDCNTAGVMVSVSVFEVTPPWVALMLVKPTPTPMARPAALMLAMVSSEELQVAVLVRSCVLPSLKVQGGERIASALRNRSLWSADHNRLQRCW